MKKLLGIIALLAIVAIVAYLATRPSGTTSPTLRVSGNIEATSVAVSFKLPGRVTERLVDEGDTVTSGQIVARLEKNDLEHEAAAREADRRAARAALAELEAGSRKEEIAQAEAALARAATDAERLDADYLRVKALYDREVVPKRELDASKAARDAARATVNIAKEALTLARKGPRKEKIDQARALLKESEAAHALSRTRLGYTALAAPLAGTVLAKHIEPGEQVAAGTPIITVADLSSVWMRAYIGESDLGRVKLGQSVRVTTDTYPGKSYAGKVTFLASDAEFTPKNVQTQKERVKLVYRIKITIPNQSMELKPGMPADAEISINN